MQILTHNINLPEFPGLVQMTSINLSEQSLFFCVSYSLLKIYLRSKQNKQIFELLNQSISNVLSSLMEKSTPEARQYLELYTVIVNTIKDSQEYSKAEIWLKSCINPQYLNSLLGVTYVGQYIAFYLVQYFKSDFNEIISNDPCQILMFFSQYFSVYIHVIWDSGNYLYDTVNNSQGYLLYIYYNTLQKHFYLLHDTDDKLENIQLIIIESYRNSLESYRRTNSTTNYYSDINERKAIGSFTASTAYQNSLMIDKLQDLPEFCQLIQNMVELLIDKGLFTQKIQHALDLAIEEDEYLLNIEGIKKLKEIQDVFCEEHKNNVYVKLNCSVKHCQECIFDKIFREFSRSNFKIYCPCGKQIAPKDVDEIKKDFKYQEYCARSRAN